MDTKLAGDDPLFGLGGQASFGTAHECIRRKTHWLCWCILGQVSINGDKIGDFESQSGSTVTSLGISEGDVRTITLESIGINKDEWISLLEVSWPWPDGLLTVVQGALGADRPPVLPLSKACRNFVRLQVHRHIFNSLNNKKRSYPAKWESTYHHSK